MNILPEKYYESCVTHNIVSYYLRTTKDRIFPFSISQTLEKEEGYDFGYLGIQDYFLIQYKRPRLHINNKYSWDIDMKQLNTIIKNGYAEKVYYCLPMFNDIFLWYDALKYVRFAKAGTLYNYLNLKGKKSINSNDGILLTWGEISDNIINRRTALIKLEEILDNKNVHVNNVLHEVIKNNILGEESILYLVGGERDAI